MSHITQIPEAVRIAAATSGVAPELKQQAIDYLGKVKELCEETYQVSDTLSMEPVNGLMSRTVYHSTSREPVPRGRARLARMAKKSCRQN
jgi:hypothetical protein